ncbi:hypothetical protein [Litoribacillus peritrichatus]|uniref:Acyl-CoA dehydrogenase family protein n=1 Tax=Litoribacillus peritrichatus TaxID=718191 RepID=A0ABP7M5I6_9GAMM
MEVWTALKSKVHEYRSVSDQSLYIRTCLETSRSASLLDSLEVLVSSAASASSSASFWLGYQVAIQKLFGHVLEGQLASFVVNEKKSPVPKHWQTSLNKQGPDALLELQGAKDFVTADDQIEALLVAANLKMTSLKVTPNENQNEQKPECKVALIPCQAKGVQLTEFDGMPVFKDLKKARSVFDRVHVADQGLLPGDGYDLYVKPFRVVEDFYVSASLLGYVSRLLIISGELKQENNLIVEQLNTLFKALAEAERDLLLVMPECQTTSFLFETVLRDISAFISEMVLKHKDDAGWEGLTGDLMVLKIGEKARSIRYDRASERLT